MYNIILITVDCLRADHLSCFGYNRISTPNIDKLAEKGAIFYNAFSNGPYTTMSFPSIFTSTYPLMYPYIKENNLFITDERTSFVDVLKRYGIRTAAFHSNPHLSGYFGYNKGFDLFEDHISRASRSRARNISVSNNLKKIGAKIKAKDTNLYKILKKGYDFIQKTNRDLGLYLKKDYPYIKAEVLNQEVLNYVSKNPKKFFVWIHYMDIHAPYLPPQPLINHIRNLHLQKRTIYKNKNKGDLKKISNRDIQHLVNLYDKGISYIDHELGKLLKHLKNFDIHLDNTYIILTSDHGEEFMEHGDLGHLPKLYDDRLHIPLIIAGPGLEKKKVKNQVSLINLAPSILDLIGANNDTSFLGDSLIPLITLSPNKEDEDVISEYWFKDERGYSYRTKKWKCIITFNPFDIKKELYNLIIDPEEQINIAEKNKSITKKYFNLIKTHINMERKSFKTLTDKKRLKNRIKKLKTKNISL